MEKKWNMEYTIFWSRLTLTLALPDDDWLDADKDELMLWHVDVKTGGVCMSVSMSSYTDADAGSDTDVLWVAAADTLLLLVLADDVSDELYTSQ